MTALGKVLVFFNVLFALVTGGLIVVVFLTRTNWRLGMEAAQQETKAARAALESERSAATQKRLDYEAEIRRLQEEISRLNTVILGKDVEIAGEKKKYNEARAESMKAAEISNAASAEIARLQTERNQMSVQLNTLNEQLVQTARELAETTARETFHKLRADSNERELASLKDELASVRRKYEELRARVPATATLAVVPNAPRAPSIETSGRVTGVAGNLASISLGSDNGIEQGHVLQVYRMGANPLYLGTLTVTRTEPHRAVGTFEPAARGRTIAVDDRVDTRILR
jgi:predicted  nucleic acid-binding Zn-ribbon protein